MKTIIKTLIYTLTIVCTFCLILVSCKKDKIVKEDPFGVITLDPPSDNIPYEALGTGKILFARSDETKGIRSFNLIDIDHQKTSAFMLNSMTMQPSISPDGLKIVCSLYLNDTTAYDDYVMNTDGSGCYLVYKTVYQDRFPSWTIDGSKILVYSASRYGPLYMQSPVKNATDRVELTKFYYDDDPFWFIETSGGFSISPDQKLVCSNLINQIRGLLIIEPFIGKSGVSLLLPTPTGQNFESPAFSPDGTKIAFLVVETNPNVYGWNAVTVKTIDPDGSNLTELVRVVPYETPANWMSDVRDCDVSLCWSPDGTKILFTVPTEEFGCHLFVINSDGSDLTQVTDNIHGYDIDVSWGR